MEVPCAADLAHHSAQHQGKEAFCRPSLPEVRQRYHDYQESLFSGDLCCKLWFTVPRSASRKFLSRLTDLLRSAVVDQREDVNAHIPHEVFRGLAGHTRDKVCIANHKVFWPYPLTLLHLFGDMKVSKRGKAHTDLSTSSCCRY